MSIPYSALRGDQTSEAIAATHAMLLATIQAGMVADINGDAHTLITEALERIPADQLVAGVLLVSSQILLNVFDQAHSRAMLIELLRQQAVIGATDG